MPPKVVIVLEESDGEVEITSPRLSKIAKTAKFIAPSDLAPEMNLTTCWDLTGPSETLNSSHGLPLPLSGPSCVVLNQGRGALFGNKWSFSALKRSSQLSSISTSRSSSTTANNSPLQTSTQNHNCRYFDLASPSTPQSLEQAMAISTIVVIPDDEDQRVDVCANSPQPIAHTVDLTTDDEDDDIFFIDHPMIDQGPSGIITFEDYEFDDEELGPEIFDIGDDSGQGKLTKIRRAIKILPQRNGPVAYPFRTLSVITHRNMSLASDMIVEIKEPGMKAEDAYFLEIVRIISNDSTGEVTLRGHRIQRTKDGNGILEKKLNEVYLCREVDLDDPRKMSDQSLIEVPLTNVIRTRELRYTNRNYPRARAIGNAFSNDQKSYLYENGGLTLRWRYTCTFLTATHRNRNKYGERVLERFHSADTAQYSVSEASLRQTWRGNTIAGGAFVPSDASGPDSCCNISQPMSDRPISTNLKRTRSAGDRVESTRHQLCVIDLSDNTHCESPKLPRGLFAPMNANVGELHSNSVQKARTRVGQKYTFGDAFCGAGGTTRGAEMAGLKVIWGFDLDPTACTTWRQNFEADCYQMEAFKFADIFKNTNGAVVDILHLSPPCQFFAPCHTRPGPNDEANSAALFAVQEVIKIAKPRIVTLEQTLGLGRQRQHQGYLNSLIQMFTRAGFSVRWKIVFLAPWGLPARRERLVIIAACPGEILPAMPKPTHSENGEGGLKPYITVNQTIANLHPNTNLDPDIRYFDEVQLQHPKINPYDGNKILPKAITCSGGDYNYHPSGKRAFTIREFAALQGFPPVHTFSGMSSQGMRLKGSTIVRKQIGNAVPPVVARTLFESIIKDLKKADGIESEHILIE